MKILKCIGQKKVLSRKWKDAERMHVEENKWTAPLIIHNWYIHNIIQYEDRMKKSTSAWVRALKMDAILQNLSCLF